MNILYVIHRYLSIINTPPEERKRKFLPRSVLFGGNKKYKKWKFSFIKELFLI